MSTPIFPFAKWLSGTNQNSIPANDNSLRNQILNGWVISQSTTAQPVTPAEGDIYIIPASATGTQWTTFTAKDLAIYSSGTWYAFAPSKGARVNLAGAGYQYDGSAWVAESSGGGGSDRSTVTALSIASGVVNIDCALGDYFTLALNANVTSITFSNLPGSGKGASVMLRVTQDSTPRTVAWPASFRWEGAAPSVSTASGAIDLLAISTLDNGTKWDATLSKGRV